MKHSDELIERVAKALQKECMEIFGAKWSNDVAWRLARAAIEAMQPNKDSTNSC